MSALWKCLIDWAVKAEYISVRSPRQVRGGGGWPPPGLLATRDTPVALPVSFILQLSRVRLTALKASHVCMYDNKRRTVR